MRVNRRNFLGSLLGSAALVAGYGLFRNQPVPARSEIPLGPILEDAPASSQEMVNAVHRLLTPGPVKAEFIEAFNPKPVTPNEEELARYLEKMQNFEESHQEDVFLEPEQTTLLVSSFQRIDRVQTLVGHGNFNVIGFDDMLNYARHHTSVGEFTKQELDFLELVFFDDVERYGFFGEKVVDSLTAVVNERDRVKVNHTGHYLFRGQPLDMYQKIRQDVGDNVILTSGIRGIVKQTHLFLAKTIQADGNLSLASRSLAPPGHSFHGIGDFDVGKLGFGALNFTSQFAHTDEYRRLVDLGYLDMRYPEQNLFGVRFEPWHIKVA